MDNRYIGIFDSGMGGLSVLGKAANTLKNESFIYFGDNAYAPYGIKSKNEIYKRVEFIVDYLLNKNIKALVIACNTASSVAAETLRKEYDIPIIAMEPALKLAYDTCPKGTIMVLATELTLKLNKFTQLMSKYGSNAIPIPCPDLVTYVENHQNNEEQIGNYIHKQIDAFDKKPDVIVLGCTHFVFIKDFIQSLYPESLVIDGNSGTVKQLERILIDSNITAVPHNKQKIKIISSKKDPQNLQLMYSLLNNAMSFK